MSSTTTTMLRTKTVIFGAPQTAPNSAIPTVALQVEKGTSRVKALEDWYRKVLSLSSRKSNAPTRVEDDHPDTSVSANSEAPAPTGDVELPPETAPRLHIPKAPGPGPEVIGQEHQITRSNIKTNGHLEVISNDDSGVSRPTQTSAGASHNGGEDSAAESSLPAFEHPGSQALELSQHKGLNSSSTQNHDIDFDPVPTPELQVRIPVPLLERLRVASTVTRLDHAAVPVLLTSKDKEKLRTFSLFLSRVQDQITLFGKELPVCRHYLVAVTKGGNVDHFICVEGLTSKKDIKLFHKVMSQSRYRYLYHPWKLCYEASEIRRPAGPLTSPTGEDPSDDLDTYCGRTAVSHDDIGGTWTSTIGGVIELSGALYTMTTAHRPDSRRASDDTADSPADTLVDGDFPETVQPAYLVGSKPDGDTAGKDVKESSSGRPTIMSENPWSPGIILQDLDLKLLPISREDHLPNYVQYKSPSSGPPGSGWKRNITSTCSAPGSRPVFFKTGVSGLCKGYMEPSSSFLVEGGKPPLEVWTMRVNWTDDTPAPIQGDSGAWVCSASGWFGLAEAIGPISACSTGRAHVRLLSEIFQAIAPTSGIAKLPSPVSALLDSCISRPHKLTMARLASIPPRPAQDDRWGVLATRFFKRVDRRHLENLAFIVSKYGSETVSLLETPGNGMLLEQLDVQARRNPSGWNKSIPTLETWQHLTEAYRKTKDDIERAEAAQLTIQVQNTLPDSNPHRAPKKPSSEPGAERKHDWLPASTYSWLASLLRPKKPQDIGTQPTHEPPSWPRFFTVLQGCWDSGSKPDMPEPSPYEAYQRSKRDRTSLLFRILLITGSCALGGTVAALTWQNVYADEAQFPYGAQHGAIAGSIVGSALSVHLYLDYLCVVRFGLGIARRQTSPGSAFSRHYRPIAAICWALLRVVGFTYARVLFVVLYLLLQTGEYDTGGPSARAEAITAACIAAVPSIITTLLFLTSASRKLAKYFSLDQVLRLLVMVGLESAVVVTFLNNYRPTGQDAINVRSAVAVAAVFWSVTVFWPFVTGIALLGTPQGVDALYTVRRKVFKIEPPSRSDRDVEASSADVSRDISRNVSSDLSRNFSREVSRDVSRDSSRDVSSIELGPLTPP